MNNPITRKIEILIDTDIDYLEGVAHNIVTCCDFLKAVLKLKKKYVLSELSLKYFFPHKNVTYHVS